MNWVNRMSWLRFSLAPLFHGKMYSFTCDTDSEQYETLYSLLWLTNDIVYENWAFERLLQAHKSKFQTKFYHFFYLFKKRLKRDQSMNEKKAIRPFYGHLIVAFAFISINLLIHMNWTVFNFSEWIFSHTNDERKKNSNSKNVNRKIGIA